MKKFLIIILGLFCGLYIFAPKTKLIYLLEYKLSKQHIYINASVQSDILKSTLKKGKIFINKINIADFEKTVIYPYILYNKIVIENLKLNIGNYNIKKGCLTYAVYRPFTIKISATANFGDINGFINLKKHFIKIYIFHIKDNMIKKFLRKDKKGYYYYDKY